MFRLYNDQNNEYEKFAGELEKKKNKEMGWGKE